MDLYHIILHGGCAAILLYVAAILWRRGASLLPLRSFPGMPGARRPWAMGLLSAFVCQTGIPSAAVSVGMSILGLKGALLFGIGAGAGFLMPAASFLSLPFSALFGAAGLLFTLIPFKKSRLPARGVGFLLLSLCCVALFDQFAGKAASAAAVSPIFPSPFGYLRYVPAFLLGICLCYLLESEGFALLVPGIGLRAGLLSVTSCLFFAAGVFIGSFLRVLVLAWEWRRSADRQMGMVCLHRVLTAFFCLACAFTVPEKFSQYRFAVLLGLCLLPLAASLVLIPFCGKTYFGTEAHRFWHPLFTELPRYSLGILKTNICRLFSAERELFVLSMESLLKPNDPEAGVPVETLSKALFLEKEIFQALEDATETIPGNENSICLHALEKAANGLSSVRAASEHILSLRGETVPSQSVLNTLEDNTLRDFDSAAGAFSDKNSVPAPPAGSSFQSGERKDFPSDADSVRIDEICAFISLAVQTAGETFIPG
ncbi:MAG: hypothetical protein IKP22_06295 [Clostridia bacterium]|nr:hypothetical protein [Clostridia bacterium]